MRNGAKHRVIKKKLKKGFNFIYLHCLVPIGPIWPPLKPQWAWRRSISIYMLYKLLQYSLRLVDAVVITENCIAK